MDRRTLLLRSVTLPLAGLALSACSNVERRTVQARLLGRSITVVSTVGTTLRLSWRGTTVLNNEMGEAFVPDWGLRELLEAGVVERLQASGRFSSVTRAPLTSTRREEALKELKELKTPGAHVLLISGAPSADTLWATREGFFGLGVAQRSVLRLGTESAAHVSLRADLLEPSTFGDVLGEATVATAQRVPAPALLRGPRLNDEYAAAARESLRVQVLEAVSSLVNQLGMGAERPVPAAAPQAPAPVQTPAAGRTPAPAVPAVRPGANSHPVNETGVDGRVLPSAGEAR